MTLEELAARIAKLEEALYGPFDDRLRVQERFRHGIMHAYQADECVPVAQPPETAYPMESKQ